MKNILDTIKTNKKSVIVGLAVVGASVVGTLVYKLGVKGSDIPMNDSDEFVEPIEETVEEEVVEPIDVQE